MNWSVSIAPLNSNYKSLRLAIPFVFIHITCPLQRTMLLKARMGSEEWDWGMGLGNGTGSGEWKGRMESGTWGIGNGNMKWEIENGKLFFFCVGCSFSSVLWNDFMKNKYFLSCNKQKTLFRLELNFKRRLIAVDLRFESWGVLLG